MENAKEKSRNNRSQEMYIILCSVTTIETWKEFYSKHTKFCKNIQENVKKRRREKVVNIDKRGEMITVIKVINISIISHRFVYFLGEST